MTEPAVLQENLFIRKLTDIVKKAIEITEANNREMEKELKIIKAKNKAVLEANAKLLANQSEKQNNDHFWLLARITIINIIITGILIVYIIVR